MFFFASLAVTNGPVSAQICQRCPFNPKKEIPYWQLAAGLLDARENNNKTKT